MSDTQGDNLAIVKTMSENGILGRWDIVRQYVADDLVMHVPPSLPFGGDYLGWDGYLRMFKQLGTYFTGLKAAEADVAACDDKVVVMSRLSGQVARTGRPISFPITAIWTLKDGKVVDIVPFYYDTKAISEQLAE